MARLARHRGALVNDWWYVFHEAIFIPQALFAFRQFMLPLNPAVAVCLRSSIPALLTRDTSMWEYKTSSSSCSSMTLHCRRYGVSLPELMCRLSVYRWFSTFSQSVSSSSFAASEHPFSIVAGTCAGQNDRQRAKLSYLHLFTLT